MEVLVGHSWVVLVLRFSWGFRPVSQLDGGIGGWPVLLR